ncbi:hypothetical protein EG329_011086 [Mollisiaceae sp. DMI_Dod_QoI]|nr:hypothetical protein EG329_011086 [Helotiales sp. DMI_Dod_QoI]
MLEPEDEDASPFDFCEDLLQDARAAMEDDDVYRFKHLREEIITVITQHMTNARDHLFDRDAGS